MKIHGPKLIFLDTIGAKENYSGYFSVTFGENYSVRHLETNGKRYYLSKEHKKEIWPYKVFLKNLPINSGNILTYRLHDGRIVEEILKKGDDVFEINAIGIPATFNLKRRVIN